MDRPQRLHRSILAALVVILAMVWALTASSDLLAHSITTPPLAQRQVASATHNEDPPITGLVPPDEETRDGDLLSDAVWAGIATVLAAGAYGLGRLIPRRQPARDWTGDARNLWRAEAGIALPEPERPCLWACKVRVDSKALHHWEVQRIVLTPMQVTGAPPSDTKAVDDPKLLAPVNDLRTLTNSAERDAVLQDRLRILTRALVARVMAWSQDGCSPAAFQVTAELALPVVGTYELYESRPGRTGLTWGKPRLTWHDSPHGSAMIALGVVLGPKATELDYAGRLQGEFHACLQRLVHTARWAE